MAELFKSPKVLIVIGSGPGIGVGVASEFVSRGFNIVALLSRNLDRLQNDAASVKAAAQESGSGKPVVKTYSVDVADVKTLGETLRKIVEELGTPEVVVYNAARLGGGNLFEADEESVDRDFRISTLGLYTAAKILIPHLLSHADGSGRKPALLVTSGGLYKQPFAPYFSLSLSKASQHSLTMSLAQKYSKQGVHVAAVVVHGLVSPESDHFSPKKIASVFWDLYDQGASGEKEQWITDGKGWVKL